MTDAFGATTETLTKMIPVVVAGHALRRVSRVTTPKRRRVIKSPPKPRPKRITATSIRKKTYKPKKRTAKRGRRK